MKSILLCLTGLYLLVACGYEPKDEKSDSSTPHDTIIISKPIVNELAGSAYRKHATAYMLVVGKDTSHLQLIMARTKAFGRISIDLRFKRSMSYSQQWTEIKKLLPYAMTHFDVNPDSLQLIFIGRLITTGDLAIDITDQHNKSFSPTNKPAYSQTISLLMKSKLVKDWNELLNPHATEVDTIFVEKIFFTERDELYRTSKIETDSSAVPSKILDCMVWLRLRKLVRPNNT